MRLTARRTRWKGISILELGRKSASFGGSMPTRGSPGPLRRRGKGFGLKTRLELQFASRVVLVRV